jgi:hypothetical protein
MTSGGQRKGYTIPQKGIVSIIEELAARRQDGRPFSSTDHLVTLRRISQAGGLQTLEPILPLALQLNRQPYHLADHFPFSPLFDATMAPMTLYKTGRQVSKTCQITDDNRVSLANGRPVPGHQLQVGDTVMSFAGLQPATGTVTAKIDAGSKDVVRVTTRLGSVVDIALTHPLRTLSGWRLASRLRVGDRIAGARRGGCFGKNGLTARVLLTAYMLGDGCFGCSGNWSFTSEPGPALDEFIALSSQYESQGPRVAPKDDSTALCVNLHCDNEILRWAAEDGLTGRKSGDRFVPAWVFDLDRTATAAFISRLWATDGWLTTAANGTPAIGYCSTSATLAYDLRALLTKFGIPTSVSERSASYRDKETGILIECSNAFVVRVETRDGWRAFMETFNVPGKPVIPIPQTIENNNRDTVPQEVDQLIAVLAGEHRGKNGPALHQYGLHKKPKYPLSYPKLEKYVEFFQKHTPNHPRLPELEQLCCRGVIWDEIVSISPRGRKRCWDVTVASLNNYVLNGLLSHNSTSLAAHGVILAGCVPGFKTLYVTPLYEQIRRFSNNYVRPFIEYSPISHLWTGTSTERSVLQRSFSNGAMMQFSFALLDADRVRGIAADKVGIDEVQDMDPDHLPIIRETMSHSSWSVQQFTGTPKSLDNPIEGLWSKSSQAEWFIPCYACGTWSIPSLEYHLEKMIGPHHMHISERYPAVVCHKCRKPISPRPPHGRWVHRYESRRLKFAGYHVPQIILPLHYARQDKWAELLNKQAGWGRTTLNAFYNEVLGESVDVGQKIVTESEVRAASVLPWQNRPNEPDAEIFARLPHYQMRIMGIDWGGGGEEGISFTCLALMGLTATGKIHCLWGKRLLSPNDHLKEAGEILYWVKRFGVHLIAHDYTGTGTVRETVLVQAGYDLERIMAIQLVRTATRSLMRPVAPTPLHQRLFYRLDKARSLLYTAQAIKLNMLQFFQFDKEDKTDESESLLNDFMALVAEQTRSRFAGDIFTITRNPMLSDDFAQAVNLGAAGLWHSNNCWPNFAYAARFARVTAGQIEAAGSMDYGWDNDRSMSGYFHQP